MTEEEKKIINRLECLLENLSEYGLVTVVTEENQKDIKTALNLIQSQQKEIENKDNKIWQLKSQIQDLENECISLHELIDEGM